jgi:hypothetical protein
MGLTPLGSTLAEQSIAPYRKAPPCSSRPLCRIDTLEAAGPFPAGRI